MSDAAVNPDPLPHDLLWIDGADALSADAPLPGWVADVLRQVPVVVVRRARSRDGLVPVGVRGRAREERFAAVVPLGAVRRRMAPEQLMSQQQRPHGRRLAAIPALRALADVAAAWADAGAIWGPAGSVGFELATGWPAATPASDLDLIVRAPRRLSRDRARALLAALDGIAVVADVRIELAAGSLALREFCRDTGERVLLRTVDGPRLVRDPWDAASGETSGDAPGEAS